MARRRNRGAETLAGAGQEDRLDELIRQQRARLAETAAKAEGRALHIDQALLFSFESSGLPSEKIEQLRSSLTRGDRRRARFDLAEHRKQEVKRLSEEGRPVGAIADELGLNYYYVVQLRAALGISKPRKPR